MEESGHSEHISTDEADQSVSSSRQQPKRRFAAPVCKVEGCGASVENMKTLNLRYKICEKHAKAEYVIQGGRRMRFCQQCSRLQPVEEFDGSKRNCRERLERIGKRRKTKLQGKDTPVMCASSTPSRDLPEAPPPLWCPQRRPAESGPHTPSFSLSAANLCISGDEYASPSELLNTPGFSLSEEAWPNYQPTPSGSSGMQRSFTPFGCAQASPLWSPAAGPADHAPAPGSARSISFSHQARWDAGDDGPFGGGASEMRSQSLPQGADFPSSWCGRDFIAKHIQEQASTMNLPESILETRTCRGQEQSRPPRLELPTYDMSMLPGSQCAVSVAPPAAAHREEPPAVMDMGCSLGCEPDVPWLLQFGGALPEHEAPGQHSQAAGYPQAPPLRLDSGHSDGLYPPGMEALGIPSPCDLQELLLPSPSDCRSNVQRRPPWADH
uniref:Squamosa promoter-binding-like protein 8-like n=1 Tax=Tetraselmis sp. GSL018 TaxID=582737 RepID=A0A061QR04_9CHLO